MVWMAKDVASISIFSMVLLARNLQYQNCRLQKVVGMLRKIVLHKGYCLLNRTEVCSMLVHQTSYCTGGCTPGSCQHFDAPRRAQFIGHTWVACLPFPDVCLHLLEIALKRVSNRFCPHAPHIFATRALLIFDSFLAIMIFDSPLSITFLPISCSHA